MLKRLCENAKIRKDEYHEENQYLNLINDILVYGNKEKGRNGETLAIFGAAMHFSLEDGVIPLLTTKKVAWKTCLKELLWFIKGSTDNKLLKEQNVKIWNGNGSREFLDSRGLTHYEEDDLGPVYGWQWRRFNQDYKGCKEEPLNNGVGDQLANIISQLKNPETRNSRRLVMSAWNPLQLDEMALPPCHVLVQFNVFDSDKLSCSLYQRSGDVGLGVPFNIASYSFLTHIIAKHCGLKAMEFNYFLGNAHIYDDHIEPLKKQLYNVPHIFPRIEVIKNHDKIDNFCVEDIKIIDYIHFESIKMEMRK